MKCVIYIGCGRGTIFMVAMYGIGLIGGFAWLGLATGFEWGTDYAGRFAAFVERKLERRA